MLTIINNLLESWGLSQEYSLYVGVGVNIIIAALFLWFFHRLIKKLIPIALTWFLNSTKVEFNNYLMGTKFLKYITRIPSYILIYALLKILLEDFPTIQTFFLQFADIYLILLIVWIIRSIIRATKRYLRTKDTHKDKPIDSLAQVVMMTLWAIAILMMLSILTHKSIGTFLTTLGAASAVLLLVFKDSILGFVASIQVSTNNIVRIDDWITQEKYGADGTVIEINLTTVKVQNFDNTITTIPTYNLISDSFTNWRGMNESKGRRIKRSIYIKQSSVKFLNKDEINATFTKIQMLKDYIEVRQKEIEQYNTTYQYDNKSVPVNGRNQTNLGLFRRYCETYLEKHPLISKDLTLMVRLLAPTEKGIPVEVYVFSNDKEWVNYEKIQSDIFEHIIASVRFFDLEIYELNFGSCKHTSSTI